MISKRKFYRTLIQVEVLSEEPFEYDTMADVHERIADGDCSGTAKVVLTDELSGKSAAFFLKRQGSSPEFFRLNEKGEDLDD